MHHTGKKKVKKKKKIKKKGYEKFAEGDSNFRVSPNQLALKVNSSYHWTASVKGKKYSLKKYSSFYMVIDSFQVKF